MLASDSSDRPRLHAAFKLAVDSISRYPLPLRSAEEAGELVGIGDFIAHRIGHILQRRRAQHDGTARDGEERTGDDAISGRSTSTMAVDELGQQSAGGAGGGGGGSREDGTRRRYTPKEGGAAMQLLLALSSLSLPQPAASSTTADATGTTNFTLAALLRQAVAMFPTNNTTAHTANVKAALKKLAKEALIVRHSGDGGEKGAERLSITSIGSVIAKQIDEKRRDTAARSSAAAQTPTATSYQRSVSPPASPAASSPPLLTLLPFSQFTLHLAVDIRERRFHSHPQLPHASLARALPAGDFLWLLRHTESGAEYVVDLIAERKRVSDLVASVKDGRMREQRWRMKRSGMTCKLYIIEGDIPAATTAAAAHYAIPSSTLESVLSSLSVVHGYSVMRTVGVSWTVALLGELHKQLEADMREEGVLLREEYRHFEERMKKRGGGAVGTGGQPAGGGDDSAGGECDEADQRQMWGSQLRMIRGISPMIAAAIVAQYPSLDALRRAYSDCSSRADEERLLADVAFGQRKSKVGQQLSRRVRDVMRLETYDIAEWEQVTAERDREEKQQRRDKQQRRKARDEDRQRRRKEQNDGNSHKARQRRENEDRNEDKAQLAVRRAADTDEADAGESGLAEEEQQRMKGREDGGKEYMLRAASFNGRMEVEVDADGAVAVNGRAADWQQRQQVQHVVELEDEAVLREMRARVQQSERVERKQSRSLSSGPSGASDGAAASVDGRKLTAKQRLRQRDNEASLTKTKRARPRRGVIQLDSDADEERSCDDDELQCWMADSRSTSDVDDTGTGSGASRLSYSAR